MFPRHWVVSVERQRKTRQLERQSQGFPLRRNVRAFRSRKAIHTQHLSEFNVKGAALITAKSVSFIGPFKKGVKAAMRYAKLGGTRSTEKLRTSRNATVANFCA